MQEFAFHIANDQKIIDAVKEVFKIPPLLIHHRFRLLQGGDILYEPVPDAPVAFLNRQGADVKPPVAAGDVQRPDFQLGRLSVRASP